MELKEQEAEQCLFRISNQVLFLTFFVFLSLVIFELRTAAHKDRKAPDSAVSKFLIKQFFRLFLASKTSCLNQLIVERFKEQRSRKVPNPFVKSSSFFSFFRIRKSKPFWTGKAAHSAVLKNEEPETVYSIAAIKRFLSKIEQNQNLPQTIALQPPQSHNIGFPRSNMQNSDTLYI